MARPGAAQGPLVAAPRPGLLPAAPLSRQLYRNASLATWGGNMLGIADIEGELDVGRVSRSVELSD